jgi:uncharacterized protein YvpB
VGWKLIKESKIQGFGHFVVIIGWGKGMVYYHDPDIEKDLSKDTRIFLNAWARCSFKRVKIWKSVKK